MNITKLLTTALAISLLLTSGCVSRKLPKFNDIRFNELAAYKFDVSKIEVVEAHNPNSNEKYVENMFPVTPLSALKTWAEDRLQTKGLDGKNIRMIVQDASVTETALPRTKGLRGVFTNDQTELYKANLEVKFELLNNEDPLFNKSEIKVHVTRSKSVTQHTSLADRERLYYSIVKDLIQDFNKEFEKTAPHFFGNLIFRD